METNGALPMLGWMSALADATRARTLRLIERHELTVADLCQILQAPQSTVSRHLKVLSDDGWVAARPEGTSRLYRLAATDLEPAARRLWSLLREQTAQTSAAEHDDQRLQQVLEKRRTRSQAFFSSAAGQWDRVRHEMFGDRFDALALASLVDGDAIVGDLGCGTGQVAEMVAPFAGRVIAVESSREMVRAARARLAGRENVELRRGDLEALPIADAALDIATIFLVLHHLASPQDALREAARALRAGGRLIVVDMLRHDRSEYQQQMGHVWLGFEEPQLTQWLEQAGFARIRVRALPPESQAKGPALFIATAVREGTAPANDLRREA